MSNLRRRAGTPRVLIIVLAVLAALTLAGAANAEFPTKRSDPSISGTPQEGQTLTGRSGQWLDANGLPCTDCSIRYTWQRCNADLSGCGDIPGATGLSYLLVASDVGRRLRLVEWISKRDCNAIGQDCRDVEKNGTSAPTPPIAAKPILVAQASAPPSIAGLAMEEEILQATGGTWTGPGTITKAFFWQRCNAVGEGCATIAGANGATYRLTNLDVGSRVRVIETATNQGGTAQAVSNTTSVVAELRPTASRPTIAAAKVLPPHRLIVDRIAVTQSGQRVLVRIRVSDDRGFRVSGVLVKAQPTGLLAGSTAARATAASGWATFVYSATGSGRTFVYAEAAKRGERAQSGVSSANLFRIRVR